METEGVDLGGLGLKAEAMVAALLADHAVVAAVAPGVGTEEARAAVETAMGAGATEGMASELGG